MNEQNNEKKKINKKELCRTVKFTLFSISAGAIQALSSLLLELVILKLFISPDATINFIGERNTIVFVSTTVGLILSIAWNFTFNRKFTFKAANNVPIAMLLAFAFYIPFYPFQVWYVDVITKELAGIGDWGFIIAQGTCMIINFVLEFLWQKFVVFRNAVDTNEAAKKEQEKNVVAESGEKSEIAKEPDNVSVKTENSQDEALSQKIEADVILKNAGSNKPAVIKALITVAELDLEQAKKLVESAPVTVAEKRLKDEALKLADELRKVGAEVELK